MPLLYHPVWAWDPNSLGSLDTVGLGIEAFGSAQSAVPDRRAARPFGKFAIPGCELAEF